MNEQLHNFTGSLFMKTSISSRFTTAICAVGLAVGASAATYSWQSLGPAWTTPIHWSPAGPPGPSDDAVLPDTGFRQVDHALAGAVGTITLSPTALPSYSISSTLNYDFIPPFPDLVTATAMNKNGAGAATLFHCGIVCSTLNINAGSFEFSGTNDAAFGSVNIYAGSVLCVRAYDPSRISAAAWNVAPGGTMNVSGMKVVNLSTAQGLIGHVYCNGFFNPGCSLGTANVNGSLSYSSSGRSQFELSQPNVVGGVNNDLVNVYSNLTLNGTIDIVGLSGFGAGTYRLFNYAGVLVNNGVALGNVPAGYSAKLDFSTTNQVDLVVTQLQSYVIHISNCCTLIANQLDKPGGNTLGNLMPSLPVDCRFMKWDNTNQVWRTNTYSTTCGWADVAMTLSPGEGAFLCPCTPTNFFLTFTGTFPSANLPVTLLPGQWYLLSRQSPLIGTYDTIVGLIPVGATMAFTYTCLGYSAYTFDPDDLVWYPNDFTVPVGTALWIHTPGGGGTTPPPLPVFPCPTNCIQSYTITVSNCCTLIANQLDKPGGNSLNNIIPSLPVNCRFMKYHNASGTWVTTTYSTVSGWANGLITLDPGEGAFLCPCCPTNFNLTFTGLPHVPVLPITIPPGSIYLLSRQTSDIGTYENIVGTAPPTGARLYRWNCTVGYVSYAKGPVGWSPSTPTVAVGESVWIQSPGGGGSPPVPPEIECPTNSASGFKFNDLNGDGIWGTNEPVLTNWTINLYGMASNLIASSQTDATGRYQFDLSCETYMIQEVLQPGWSQTYPTNGSYLVNANSGPITNLNFGNIWTTNCQLSIRCNEIPKEHLGGCYPVDVPDIRTKVLAKTDYNGNPALLTCVQIPPPGPPATFDLGYHEIVATVTDGLGCQAQCTVLVEVTNTGCARIYFGEDENHSADGTGQDNPSRIAHPISDNARAAFLARLLPNAACRATEDFESYTPGFVPNTLAFGSHSATVTGSRVIASPPITLNGVYPTSGTNTLLLSMQQQGFFTLDFGTDELCALGFYATDVEVAQLQITLSKPSSGYTKTVTIPARQFSVGQGSGSVLFFGVVDPDHPFTKVEFKRVGDSQDGFGFDDLTVAPFACVRCGPVLECPSNIVICITSNGCGQMPNIASQVQVTADDLPTTFWQSIPENTWICQNTSVQVKVTDKCNRTASCTIPVLLDPCCLTVVRECVRCASGNSYTYKFEVRNDSKLPASYIYLAGAGGSPVFTPNMLYLNPPLQPGQTVTNTVNLSATDCGTVCFQIGLLYTNFDCCNIEHCVTLPNCCPPRTYSTLADFSEGQVQNLIYTNGALRFPSRITPPPYVYIACSARGTVVLIDANDGKILGEYYTAPVDPTPGGTGYDHHGPNDAAGGQGPSRTTVDLNGNVWVANRNNNLNGNGTVTRIALVVGGERGRRIGTPPNHTFVPDSDGDYLRGPFERDSGAQDRDKDGLIHTSKGLGRILEWKRPEGKTGEAGDGTVRNAEDECIINYTVVKPTGVRTIAVDENNDVWIGGNGYGNWHEKLNGATGNAIAGTLFQGEKWAGGYGGFIDGNNVLWSARGSGRRLLRVDLNTLGVCNVGCGRDLGNVYGDYGLSIDPCTGNIWYTTYGKDGKVYVLRPDGSLFKTYDQLGKYVKGIAVDDRQNVWIANIGGNSVGHLLTDGTVVGSVGLGREDHQPTGVAIDSNGKIWVSCLNSSKALRIDPTLSGGLGKVDLEVDLGTNAGPYNYSDKTGFIGFGVTKPSGTWSVVREACIDGASWGRISWTACPGTRVEVWIHADDNALSLKDKPLKRVQNGCSLCGTYVIGPSGFLTWSSEAIKGRYLGIHVTLFRDNPCGTSFACLSNLTVSCCQPLSLGSVWDPWCQGTPVLQMQPYSILPSGVSDGTWIKRCDPSPFTTNLSAVVGSGDGRPVQALFSVNGVILLATNVPGGGVVPTSAAVDFIHTYQPGSNIVSVVVTDGVNEPLTNETAVIIGDVDPPRWNGAFSVTTNDFAGVVPLFQPTLIDDCSSPAQLTVTQDIPPGTVVTQGTYLVTLAASDLAGNRILTMCPSPSAQSSESLSRVIMTPSRQVLSSQ